MEILSCIPNDNYEQHPGTSTAAPYVAGACALVWTANPDLSHLEVKDRILDSVDKLDCLDANCVSEGRLNLYQAMPLDIGIVDDVDDLDCRSDEEEITYTIAWENTSNRTYTDVELIDYLPAGVDYDAIISFNPFVTDPNYDENERSYTWDIGTMEPNDTGCVSLTVEVNSNSEPGLPVRNVIELYDNDCNSLLAKAAEDTPVCCWDETDPNIIYVDWTAEGGNNGTDWANAYTNLQDALYRAENTTCDSGPYTIYVAQGTYNPDWFEYDGYVLMDGMAVYGGFETGGCVFSQRNPMRYETILTGLIDEDAIPDVDTIVTMGDDTLLDGFIVTKSLDYGIYGDGVDFTIENCTVTNNENHGISAEEGDLIVKWCFIRNNEYHGIRHQGEGYTLTVENSWIMRNGEYGVYCFKSTPTVKNSIVSESSFLEFARAGIQMINPTYQPVLYNNTIANNKAEGIYFVDNGTVSDPNDKDWPDIQNCIVYYNNNGGLQLSASLNPDTVAQYCCIQDCNEVDTLNYNDQPGFAYTVDPNGRPDPKNYHLSYNSPCRNIGNNAVAADPNAMDIDGEDRIYDGYVDIGADEVCSCDEPLTEDDIYNSVDWNVDGIVNLHEFSVFSAAWLGHDPNDPAWLADPNLADPNLSEGWYEWKYICNLDATGNSQYSIDLADFALFCDEWLWTACWKLEQINEAMAMFGGESMMMAPMSMDVMSLEMEADPAVKTEPEISADTLVQIIVLLDEYLAEQPENAENIEEMRAVLIDELKAVLEK